MWVEVLMLSESPTFRVSFWSLDFRLVNLLGMSRNHQHPQLRSGGRGPRSDSVQLLLRWLAADKQLGEQQGQQMFFLQHRGVGS